MLAANPSLSANTGDVFPTTIVKVGEGYFINYSYFNYLINFQTPPLNYLISRANFDVEKRFSGSAPEIPRVNTPIVPFSYGNDYPEPYYADCSSPIASGIPDLSGEWVEEAVTINGVAIAPQPMLRKERIEQCGNRILMVSGGLLHEVFFADSTMFNGVNDADSSGLPTHFTGSFENDVFFLFPIITGNPVPGSAITREIVQDDAGNDVLKLFQPASGTTRYLVEESSITSLQEVSSLPMLTVAPNPFRDQAVVSWNTQSPETFQAQLISLTGQVVRNYPRVNGESLMIEKRDLLPGIYFLRLFSETGRVETVKLLLQE